MFWEDDDKPQEFQVPDDVIDLAFSIQCRELPVDHLYALGSALCEAAPVLTEDPRVAIHEIHLAGSQNGWERPDPQMGQKLVLSRRTKLHIRTPKELRERIEQALDGLTIEVDGHPMTIGKARVKTLSRQGTLFARHIVLEPGEEDDENAFLMRLAKLLQARGIRIKKALCGTIQKIATPEGPLTTRSLLLADLGPEDSVALQQEGLGSHQHFGCGIFLPHKGIEPVKTAEDE